MKNYIYLLGLITLLACNSTSKTTSTPEAIASYANPEQFAATITEDELKAHLYTYASDEFEGRETGTEGQKKAVNYLRQAYLDLGIPAAQENGDYFQKVPLELPALPDGQIVINGEKFIAGEDFAPSDPIDTSFQEIVYVGYGIETPEYSDYQNLDVRGKLVLVKAGEPRNADGTFVISGSDKPSMWSIITEDPSGRKKDVAKSKGARAMMYMDPDYIGQILAYYNRNKNNKRRRMNIKEGDSTTALSFVDEKLVKAIFPDWDDLKGSVIRKADIRLSFKSENEEIDTENVVAYIKGSEKPEEYIVISSHLDHIGISRDGNINNGADDDGSGSVALLEIAEAFQKAVEAGYRPRRSIVFLHVTGEEKGLLGSRYYTDYDPVFPLDETVANLNIDMIGRIDPKRKGDRNYVYLIGSDKLSSDLHTLSEKINDDHTRLTLDYTYNDDNDPNRFYYRSDHYNFAKNNIPIIFYFSGTHEDYHRPGDTPDKINYDLLAIRTRLVFYTAWEIANRDQRVIVDKTSK